MEFFIASSTMIYIAIVFAIIVDWTTFEHLNPIYNYKQWTECNWFGVAIGTLIINLLLLPVAIIFWFIKLCKVGRK